MKMLHVIWYWVQGIKNEFNACWVYYGKNSIKKKRNWENIEVTCLTEKERTDYKYLYPDRRVNKLLKEDFCRVASSTWSSSISLVREWLIKPEKHIEPGKYWKYPAPHSAWKDRQASLMCEVYSISLSFIHKNCGQKF